MQLEFKLNHIGSIFSQNIFKTHDVTELIKATPLGGSQSTVSSSADNQPAMNNENQPEKKEEEEEEIPGGFDDLFS